MLPRVRVARLTLFVFSIILAACELQSSQTPTATSTPTATPTETPPTYTTFNYNVTSTQLVTRPGETGPILMNNCGGLTTSTQTQKVENTFIISLQLDISTELAAEFGGDALIAKANVSAQIAAHTGLIIGQQQTRGTELEISTLPGHETITHYTWRENWTEGTVSIVRPNGEYIATLPWAVFSSVSFEQLGTETKICTPTPSQVIEETTEGTPDRAPTIERTTVVELTQIPQPTPVIVARQTTVNNFAVDSELSIVRTPLMVNEGEIIRIDYVSGEWTGDEPNNSPLNRGCGIEWTDTDSDHLWPLRPEEGYGAGLIGYINNEPFWIGCNSETTAPDTGILYLGINDCSVCFWDNKGSIYLDITVQE